MQGQDRALTVETKGWEHRTFQAVTERIVRGPQQGFVEVLRANTACSGQWSVTGPGSESIEVGRRTRTQCAVIYMAGIVAGDQVRRRIKSIDMDAVLSSGSLGNIEASLAYCRL